MNLGLSRNISTVVFSDSSQLYFVYDNTVDLSIRPLFQTEIDAWNWYRDGSLLFAEPPNAILTEETVDVSTDIARHDDAEFIFQSRTSKKMLWLTGPRSYFEMIKENLNCQNSGF
jgi:hypothetical protein